MRIHRKYENKYIATEADELKINIKARLKNKAFVVSTVTLVVSFVYKLLALAEIVPPVAEYEILELCGLCVNVLALAGVVVDPTTRGVSDSDRAMSYYNKETFSEVIL